jgi:putative ABC transport system permease protein
MGAYQDRSKLTSLKAVTSEYPLRGQLLLEGDQVGQTKKPTNPIQPGEVWVDPALMQSLQLSLGQSLTLGQKNFQISGVISRELDRGAGFMNFAPRVMINEADLLATELIGLGSRITYRFLVAAKEGQSLAEGRKTVGVFEEWAKSFIEQKGLRGVRLENLESGQPLMRKTLDRAERFLSLVALLTAMIAAVGVALTSQRYAGKQAEVSAVWRCLGASQKQILWGHARKFIAVTLIAGSVGVLLGWLAHAVILEWVGGLLLKELPPPSLWPALWGLLVSISIFIGFAWPPLLALSKVSPLRALRRDFAAFTSSMVQVIFFGIGSFALLLWWVAKDIKLASIVLLSFLAAGILFILLGYLSSRFVGGRIVALQSIPQGVRLAGLRLIGRPWLTALQIASLGIALMSLLLLIVVRNDLLSAWQSSVPVDAPNRFLINIQPDQKNDVIKNLNAIQQNQKIDLYPMIRGRLVQINQKSVMPSDFEQDNAQRLVDREFNLSYADQLPQKNQITKGSWFSDRSEDIAQVSMEAGIMKTLKLNLGDQLGFDIAGQIFQVKITSVRKLDWGSMRVNFFAIMPTQLLKDAPQSWITAYRQLPDQRTDTQLVAQYPNITVVDVEASLRQAQDVLSKLAMAIQLLFGFTLVAGMLVLAAALASSQEQRQKEAAVLKVMGAGRSYLLNAWNTELVLIGAIAGLLSGILASLTAWLLAKYALEIEMSAPYSIVVMGIIFGSLASFLAGYWLRSKILNTPPIRIIQGAS